MPVQHSASLAVPAAQPRGDQCPIDRTLGVVGSRPALLLLREAFYGARRFDDLARGVGVSDAVAAQRLKELVAAGVLEKEPYQEPGQRTRHEYVLTEAGHELLPVVLGLLAWGERHAAGARTSITASHADCGAPVEPVLMCAEGHRVAEDDVLVTAARRQPARQSAR
ncbi:winged helix-turn-helix transcriptional regulator [Nocardioides mangrovi]|uniref:Helix-turn-helix transcriptional regulator n=1 Tax=Nocardioides mangrovi TaxID=2874580 RepID=A0ABS7UEL5_9ACTN|nr:helix-turn-helix domain-containing protein [Nocardioides mangrovi]MBZ5739444.1 helix-turn-helix transcriptional regulator [Nocardioides mangrovi]